MKKTKYMVMRLNTEITVTQLGLESSHKIEEIAGFIVVFNTHKQAIKSAGEKYTVLPININD